MDMVHKNHVPCMRRGNNSSQYLNHLSPTNLNKQFPLPNPESLPKSNHHASYFESYSLPTTPSIFARHPFSQKPRYNDILTSKSSSHLHASKTSWSGIPTPSTRKSNKRTLKDEPDLNILSKDKSDSDWLLRTGVFMASLARESKGQTWLVPRANSTSLISSDDEDDEWGQDQSSERLYHSIRSSFIGNFSGDADDELSLRDTPINTSSGSRSRNWSQDFNISGRRSRLLGSTIESESYFDCNSYPHEIEIESLPYDTGIEIINKEKDMHQEDEVAIKMLARAYNQGLGGWIEALLGWSLLSYDEETVDIESNTVDDDYFKAELQKSCISTINTDNFGEIDLAPPIDDVASFWQDAAWLLSIAAKVLF